MSQINNPSPFIVFCQKTIPLAFDESMSFMEAIYAFKAYLENEVVPAVNTNAQAVEDLTALVNQMQEYIDHYFDNLDVQEEINAKLNAMAEDGSLYAIIKTYTDPIINELENNLQQQIDAQNVSIEAFDEKINRIASGSPLVATSVSEMTDTTRVYVNTTDGYWYYYDGDSWEQGGIYQSTGINDNSIAPEKTTFYKQIQLIPEDGWVENKVYNATNGSYVDFQGGSSSSVKIPVTAGEKLIVIDYSGYRNIRIVFWDTNDDYVGFNQSVKTNNFSIITVPANATYCRYMYYIGLTNTKPTTANMYHYNDYFNNYNDKNATIKESYFNNITSDDIIISNKIKCCEKFYKPSLITTLNHIVSNNKITITGVVSETQSTAYPSISWRLVNANVGDAIIIKSNCNANATIQQWAMNTDLPNTNTSFGNLRFDQNSTQKLIVTQEMVNFLTNNPESMLGISFGIPSTADRNFNYYFEFATEKGRTLTDFINQQEEISESTKVLVLGDSITAMAQSKNWLTYFNDIMPIQIIQNVAVNGAWLNDKTGTVYDGNPVSNGPDNNVNNVLGNQVQKVLNNNYATPEAIFIAVGTNSGINCTKEDIYKSYYDNNGNLIPLENVDRKTSAGAFRWCTEQLRTRYPNATIFWFAPIQANNEIRNLNNVINWGENLNNLTKYGSVQFINSEECGITGYTEINGGEGLYLQDGIHPNEHGAKYLGHYNATKVKEYYNQIKLNQ